MQDVAIVNYVIGKGLPYLGNAEQKTTKSTEIQRNRLMKTFVRRRSDEDPETLWREIKPN